MSLRMNILLTGGTGYIGSHAAVALIEAGHRPVLYDGFYNSKQSIVKKIMEITGYLCPVIRGDVRNTDLLLSTIENHDIHAVMHFAGLKSVAESVREPIDYYANNVQGAISLVQAMSLAGVKNLLFSSSATVYGNPHYLPIDEQHPLCAINPYGRSKLHIEEMLMDIAKADPSWSIVCLRYFNPIGAHESGLIGEASSDVPNNLMPYLFQVIQGRLESLSVFGNDYPTLDGTGVRDYIHVMDLIDGHVAALDYIQHHEPGMYAFNLGTGKGISVMDLVRVVESKVKKKVSYQIKPRRDGDIACCYANVDKAAEHLGWRAKRSIEESVVSTWRWQQHKQTHDVG